MLTSFGAHTSVQSDYKTLQGSCHDFLTGLVLLPKDNHE